ncbi:MAG: regulator, partial [bacterium]|nr:regulator [bacterium]
MEDGDLVPLLERRNGLYGGSVDLLVLGSVEVASDGERLPVGGPKQRSVLAQLVANAGHTVPIDRIVDDVYGEEADPGARRSVQTFISTFRHEFGDVIHWRGNGYVLDVDPLSIDANSFERAVTEAREVMAVDPVKAGRALREALAMWRGHPYADVDGRGSLEPEITRLRELRLSALEWRIDADLAAGSHGQLVGELEALADEYPLRERFRAQHMLALYRSGRAAEALRAYRRTEQYLADELGLEPTKELQDLELKILQQDDGLLTGAGRVVTQQLAFLVTDIEGSTKRWDRFPTAMADALAAHDRILSAAVETAGGRVFKHTGDGLLAAFPSVPAAATAAESAQRSLRDHEWGEAGELRVRMGIDAGEVESRAGDFYGPPVNRAARLTA